MNKNVIIAVALAAAAFFVVGQARAADTITGEAAHTLVKSGAFLLDVRTPGEFEGGHLDGATNIPVQVLEGKIATLPAKKDQDIVIYCRSGARSATARQMLLKAGFTRVHDLGAMSNWK